MVYYSHTRASRACIVHSVPYMVGSPEPKGSKMATRKEFEDAARKAPGKRSAYEESLVQKAKDVGMTHITNILVETERRVRTYGY